MHRTMAFHPQANQVGQSCCDTKSALTRQSARLANTSASYGDVVVTISSSPCTFCVFVVTAVMLPPSRACTSKPARVNSRFDMQHARCKHRTPYAHDMENCSTADGCTADLLLDVRDLLALLRRRCDLRTQDDVPDLRLRQRAHIDVVLLRIVCQDQVLQRNLHLWRSHAVSEARGLHAPS